MSAKRRVDRGSHLTTIAKEVTELAIAKSSNSAEYMTIMTTMLGNGIAALAREKSDLEFATMLQMAINVTIETAEYARAHIVNEGWTETKH